MRDSSFSTSLVAVLFILGCVNVIYIHRSFDDGGSTTPELLLDESKPTSEHSMLSIVNIASIESQSDTNQPSSNVHKEINTGALSSEDDKSAEALIHEPNKKTNTNSSDTVELLPQTTVAYAVSLIKCHDARGTANSANLIDASLILRHSIHQISSRNPQSGSKYDYKMFVFVHPKAERCSNTLHDLGFEVILVDHPVKREDMASEDQRKHIDKEFCCGEKEFIKLSAWTLPAELIVHLDIDFMFLKPMDHLFDAILYDKDSVEGKAAREKVMMELDDNYDKKLPDKIGAFITRDWHQVAPGKWPPGCKSMLRCFVSLIPLGIKVS